MKAAQDYLNKCMTPKHGQSMEEFNAAIKEGVEKKVNISSQQLEVVKEMVTISPFVVLYGKWIFPGS